MDRRQIKTRDAIFAAFHKLLGQKNYNKITVQDLIDEANIGRTTFYAHFATKDELLKAMCEQLFEHVRSDVAYLKCRHAYAADGLTPLSMTAHILYHIKENSAYYMGVLTGEPSNLFIDMFKNELKDLLVSDMSCVVPQSIPEDFFYNWLSSSFIYMVQWWILRDLKETPEQLAQYFRILVQPFSSAKGIKDVGKN